MADRDECVDGGATCDANAECRNTLGSFQCSCRAGYTGNGETCTGSWRVLYYTCTLKCLASYIVQTIMFYRDFGC